MKIPEGAVPGVHDAVINLLKNESPGKVLDIASGHGNISYHLKKLKFDVIAGDIEPKKFLPENIKCYRINANEKLPFQSETFDYVVSVETIEHLENPWNFIREIHRILKKDGIFIITTPNVESFFGRLIFLFTGILRGFNNEAIDESGHITPIFYHVFEKMIEGKFKIVTSTFNDGETIPLLYSVNKTRIRLIRRKSKLFGEIHIIKMIKI